MYGVRSSFSSDDVYYYGALSSSCCAEMAGFLSAGSSEYVAELGGLEVGGRRWCSSNTTNLGVVVVHQEEEEAHHHQQPLPLTTVTSAAATTTAATGTNNSNSSNCSLKHKISSHPLYPKLLQAYIDFYKVIKRTLPTGRSTIRYIYF